MDRQKMLYIFGAAWLSAALLTWFLYARTKAPKEEKTQPIVAFARDMSSGTKLTKQDLKLVPVRVTDIPKGAMTKLDEAIGRVLIYPVSANEPLTPVRVSAQVGQEGVASVIPRGYRAVSVPFTDSTGAAGLVQPRSRVDVLFTRSGGNAAEAMTVTVLEDVEVLSIGRSIDVQQVSAPGGAATKAAPRPANQTATLLVTPDQARKLELAKNNGKISLALRNPLDSAANVTAAEKPQPATMDSIDPALLAVLGKRGRRPGLRSSVSNPGEWNALIGEDGPKPKKAAPKKEAPPKPRVVVDVFRGDKHTQELFQ
jgi:pilus assembly protein CpaB